MFTKKQIFIIHQSSEPFKYSLFYYTIIGSSMGTIVQQLVCDDCNKVILEKTGEQFLNTGQFPISKEEAEVLDKQHRGHNCHIEAVEKT